MPVQVFRARSSDWQANSSDINLFGLLTVQLSTNFHCQSHYQLKCEWKLKSVVVSQRKLMGEEKKGKRMKEERNAANFPSWVTNKVTRYSINNKQVKNT